MFNTLDNQKITKEKIINMPAELTFSFSIIGILISFPVLHYVSERYFIPSLDQIASRLKMSSDIAGSTLMAVGSSTPELAIVLFAIFLPGSHLDIGVGTIVGSALFNLLVIVGIVMFISKSKLTWQPLVRDLIFFAMSVIFLISFYWNGSIDLIEASLFVLVYISYITVMYYWKRLFPYRDTEKDLKAKTNLSNTVSFNLVGLNNIKRKIASLLDKSDAKVMRNFPILKNHYISFFISIVIITFLGWILTVSAINISKFSGINEVLVGLIIIAVGTSIPDLFSSIIVAKQGRPGMAINNAIGSNIFDILIGLGIPLIILISITNEKVQVDSSNLIESFILLFGSVVLLTVALYLTKWRAKKIIGYLLIGLYIAFIIFEIIKLALFTT